MIYTQHIDYLNNWLKQSGASKVFFLVDENTHEHCLPQVLADLPDLEEYEILEIEPGEENKVLEVAANLWLSLAEMKAERRDVIVNVGGGVVTDLGGFIASTYKRGIQFLNIPTSLLAMVDAAHGGKTGIDFGGIKNVVGTFSDPQMIYSHVDFLKTLPKQHLKSGLAEMLKHGLIADAEHWNHVLKHKEDLTNQLILDSAEIKMGIVAEDPHEKGKRKLLNFGHTVGHAFESYLLQKEVPILHGEAVAAGMIVETLISIEMASLSLEDAQEIVDSLGDIYSHLPIPAKAIDEIMEWMMHDKKNVGGALRFSLLESIGKSVFDVEVKPEIAKSAILQYLK